MNQTSVFRLLAALFALSAASRASAQYDQDSLSLRVEIVPATPPIDGVVLRGDSALFLSASLDSTAYVFDRKHGRFFRARGWRKDELPHSSNAASLPRNLADSLTLDVARVSDEMTSAVIKDRDGRTVGLRGVRAEAEKKWRRAHGLSAVPAVEEDIGDPRLPHPTDWAPITPLSYAVDDDAIWIGLAREKSLYLDFALGGMLRLDRRTRRVSAVEDSSILHASVSQIERAGSDYLVIADGNVLRFDPRTMRATKLPVREYAVELLVANDTAFIAGSGQLTVFSLRDGRSTGRGFRLVVENDSVRYAIADSTVAPSLDSLAAIGAAERLGIRHLHDWLETSRGIIHARALEFYYPGDRITEAVPLAQVDSVDDEYPREGPNAIIVDGLDDKRLRPFLREALLEHSSYAHLDIVRILLSQADTAATPFMRVALKNMKDAYQAYLAAALGSLGDSTGNLWIHAALLDTLYPVGTLDTLEHIHSFTFEAAGRVRDPRNVPRLLELASHPRYGYGAATALLSYRSAGLAERVLSRVARNDSMGVLAQFLDLVVGDSTYPMTKALRDSIRAGGRSLLYYKDPRWPASGARALGRFGEPADIPALIGALTIDEFTYPYVVIALVRLTGTGSAAMPNGRGTAERVAAQRWWQAWYASHRNGLKLVARPDSDPEVTAMMQKVYR